MVYRGYFVVPVSGRYQFETQCDDFGYIWGGETAFTGWTTLNCVGGTNLTSNSVPFNEGDVVPVTFLYANGGGDALASFHIVFPDQTIVSDFSTYFTQPLSPDPWLPMPTTNCATSSSCDTEGFQIFLAGPGYNLDTDKLSYVNPQRPPIVKRYSQGSIPPTFSGILADCENEANTYGYQVIVVHYLVSENVWECIQVVGDSVYNDDNIRQSHGCSSCNICHAIEPNCTQGSRYNYYQGFGYILNYSDPSSRLHSRIFDSHFDTCSVVAQCTNFAEGSSQAPHMSINLYYGETESVWLCIVSLGSPDPALFSVRKPDISYAFGLCGPTGC